MSWGKLCGTSALLTVPEPISLVYKLIFQDLRMYCSIMLCGIRLVFSIGSLDQSCDPKWSRMKVTAVNTTAAPAN